MPPTRPIQSPASYVPAFAVGYSNPTGELAIVDAANPLPVSLASGDPIAVSPYSVPAPAPIEGMSTVNTLVGPFAPVAGRPVMLTLSGVWEGSVQLARSADGGASRHPVTVGGLAWGLYTANACEPAWEEQEAGALIYLDVTLVSGTLAYRLAQ